MNISRLIAYIDPVNRINISEYTGPHQSCYDHENRMLSYILIFVDQAYKKLVNGLSYQPVQRRHPPSDKNLCKCNQSE